MPLPPNLRLAERLVAEGLITREHQEAAISFVQRSGERIEEALLDIHALDEATLLKFLAAHHQTRFVSTEKLSKADIDRFTLDKVPKKVAERHQVFPVLFDTEANVLSIVTPDPDNATALQEVQLASNAKEIRAFISRPRAVHAAINKAYNGDIHAFAILDRQAHQQFATMLDVYERNLVTEETLANALAAERGGRERTLTQRDIEKGATVATAGVTALGVSAESYLETLNVLVTLIESTRPDLRGHSAHVARLLRQVTERIGLPPGERASAIIAGYIHDLGKMGTYHLTALNVAEYEGHRASALKLCAAPVRLMESVGLSRDAARAVECMYERYDGTGFPTELAGKEIPIAARLLAIADTYADLTQNPRNPFRKLLEPAQACEVLERFRGTVFDPNLVDVFRLTVTGHDLRARLLATRHRVLVVEPDPEETTVLELRLLEQGFEVVPATNTDEAWKVLERGDVDLVISELELAPRDGIELLELARRQEWGRRLPWVILTSRAGGADAQRAFAVGAHDFVTKPVSADLLIAKLKQIMDREGGSGKRRGVSGSLSEMSLAEMVQVLWHGRKTGALKIRSGGQAGEIHFVSGNVYNALWRHMRGEDAFFAMLGLREGDFALDPNFEAPQRLIAENPDGLLLEGMRRLDEAGT